MMDASGRPGRRALIAVLLLVVLVFTAPGLRPGRLFFYGDWLTYFLPMRTHLASGWRTGTLFPWWWGQVLGGFPVGANPQYGLFYPPFWLFAILPVAAVMPLLTAAHMFFGGYGMMRLIESRGAGREAALLGGLVYLAAGPAVAAASMENLYFALAWLPWVLHFFPAGLEEGGRRARRGAAVALAAMFLVGGLELLLWTVLLLPFWAYSSWPVYLGAGPGLGLLPPWKERAGPVVLGFVVVGSGALALTAIQLLPTLHLLGASTRLAAPGATQLAAAYVSAPGRAAGLLLPWLTWDPASMSTWVGLTGRMRAYYLPSVYIGLTLLILTAKGLRSAPDPQRRFMGILLLIGLLLGFGYDLPVIRTLAGLVPGSGYYRFGEKYLLLALPAVAWLAGWGFDGVLKVDGGRRMDVPGDRAAGLRVFILEGGMGIAAALVLLVAGTAGARALLGLAGLGVTRAASGAALAPFLHLQFIGLLLTSGVALAVGRLLAHDRRREPAGWAALAAVGLIALELSVAGIRFFATTPAAPLRGPSPAAAAIAEDGAAGRALRWTVSDTDRAPGDLAGDPASRVRLNTDWMVPNLGSLQGVAALDGSMALRLLGTASMEGAWRSARHESRLPLAGAMGVRYLLFTDPAEARTIQRFPGASALYPTADRPASGGDPPLLVLRNAYALAPLQIVYDWRIAPDPPSAYQTLVGSGLRPDRQVVLHPFPGSGSSMADLPVPPAGGLPPEGVQGSVRVLEEGSGRLRLEVTSPRAGILVRGEAPWEGWSARVDDRPVPLWAANGVLQAVPVPVGTSSVELRFHPPLFPGALFTLLGLLWLALPLFRGSPSR